MKIYSKFLLSVLLCIIAVFNLFNFSSCDDVPTDPEVEPGSRNYVWEIDTLNIPFTYLHRIWGSSSTDVWAIGPGGDLDKTIYHFDGKKWSNDGISRPISPISLWGFAHDDVWLGGNEGRIWHFNGNEWYQHLHLKDPKFIYSGFQDIWGENNTNIWAVGYLDSSDTRKGLVYHYDGIEWKRINIIHKNGNLGRIKRGGKTSKNYYIWGIWESNTIGDSSMILEYNGNPELKILDKSRFLWGEWHFVQEVDDEVIFTINNSLYTYRNNNFNLITTNPYQNSLEAIFGRNKKDIFWPMEDGLVHFNGSNHEYLFKLITEQRFSEGILFEDSAFFLVTDFRNGLNIIYRGYIKK